MHFQDLLPLSFLFICTLHWCNFCTGLEVAPNFRKFPLTAVCGIDVKRVLSSPVLDGTLFAPTQGLRCQALLALSFLFICTLQWCKRCRCSPEFAQSSIDGAICEIRAEQVVSRHVLVGSLFALTQILHFQAVLPLSFIFICILHWCKHCTRLNAAPNFRKLPLTAL